MKKQRFKIHLSVVALLLCIPLIAMQLTDEVSWTNLDFVAMAALLLGVSILTELALRKLPNNKSRVITVSFIILTFLIIWAELAVGILGTPFAGS